SSGEFADATWTLWRQNVEAGIEWLERRYGGPVMLWGLRSGSLLALDAASRRPPGGELILWQPVQDGKAMITQFLRLRIASEMLAQGKAETGVAALRAHIAQGDEVEVAGYAMTKGITAAIDDLTLSRLQPSGWRVHWFEVVPDAGRELAPAARRIVDDWRNHGIAVDAHCVAGEPFWNTVEIAECPALIELTTAALTTAEMAAP
ncbi:MAG: hydrolase 2, exosortase A system-associated, partial [Casimicrobiaceae bacterium]